MSHTEQMLEALLKVRPYLEDGANHGDDAVELLKLVDEALTAPAEEVPEPVWIVNDLGELGVKVGERFFFLYKGDNIEYEDAKHDDGTQMRYRIVGKREFGETCWPLSWLKAGRSDARYTVNLTYTPGLSWGKPEDGEWRDLPPAPLTAAPQAPAAALDAVVVRDACKLRYTPDWKAGADGLPYQASNFACKTCGYVGKHDTHPGCKIAAMSTQAGKGGTE